MRHELLKQTKTLFISAGHCERDPGARGNGVSEADLVLDLRDRLARRLAGRVVYTKDGVKGQNLPLSTAVTLATHADVAVELHCNAFTSPTATGVETLSQPHHYPLGGKLCQAVADSLGIANRGAKPEGSGRHSRLAFASQGGGIILELLFLTNPNDLRAYYERKDAVVDALARVLIEAVCVPAPQGVPS